MKFVWKYLKSKRFLLAFVIACFTFVSHNTNATYYGGHRYNSYYGHHGYPYHRSYYGNHYNYHRGYHRRYGAGAYVGGDAALIVLGVLGVALLAHTLTDNSQSKDTYPKSYPSRTPAKKVIPVTVNYSKSNNKKVYRYNANAGWKNIAKNNANTALDIFAVQSQQDLTSGTPKIGFAIAAAMLGNKRRAIHAMRKAIRIDANALNEIDSYEINHTIKNLIEDYQSDINNTSKNDDTAFMVAALSYLDQDYAKATTIMSEQDKKQSTLNLRELLENNNQKF